MSYPILYRPEERNFNHNGIGFLTDCVSCLATEEANGAFELEMQYPMDGVHYADIVDRCLLKVKPNQDAEPQLFRVYSISKPMSGIVTVSAEHISYDLSGIPVSTFTASNASTALTGLLQNAVVDCPFTFRTDKSTTANFAVTVPGSIRSKLGGVEGSVLDVYGGEFEWDNFDVILHNSRGRSNGVSIRYGKNLTDIKQDRNCANVATGIYPYWVGTIDEKEVLVELPEKIVNAEGSYNFVKIKTLDVSSEFQEKPTEKQIRDYTKAYIKENDIGVPSVSLSVSFLQIEQSEEYKGTGLLESVALFDTVNVEFPVLGVSATAKAVEVIYNALLNRVEKITLGSIRTKITDTVAKQQQQISKVPSKKEIFGVSSSAGTSAGFDAGASAGSIAGAEAAANATAWLTNGNGYKVERLGNDGNSFDTLYMETPDIETAQKVMRLGGNGVSLSMNGANGQYRSVLDLNGALFGKAPSWRDNGDGTYTLIGK